MPKPKKTKFRPLDLSNLEQELPDQPPTPRLKEEEDNAWEPASDNLPRPALNAPIVLSITTRSRFIESVLGWSDQINRMAVPKIYTGITTQTVDPYIYYDSEGNFRLNVLVHRPIYPHPHNGLNKFIANFESATVTLPKLWIPKPHYDASACFYIGVKKFKIKHCRARSDMIHHHRTSDLDRRLLSLDKQYEDITNGHPPSYPDGTIIKSFEWKEIEDWMYKHDYWWHYYNNFCREKPGNSILIPEATVIFNDNVLFSNLWHQLHDDLDNRACPGRANIKPALCSCPISNLPDLQAASTWLRNAGHKNVYTYDIAAFWEQWFYRHSYSLCPAYIDDPRDQWRAIPFCSCVPVLHPFHDQRGPFDIRALHAYTPIFRRMMRRLEQLQRPNQLILTNEDEWIPPFHRPDQPAHESDQPASESDPIPSEKST